MEEIIPKKQGRGGARPGAGRPRKNIVKSYAFHAPPEVHEIRAHSLSLPSIQPQPSTTLSLNQKPTHKKSIHPDRHVTFPL